jgi:acetolactate synthase small subunit
VRHTQHLELTVADTPLVLDRVVSTCRARQCAIVALRFEAADRHRPGRVWATVEGDARRARLAAQRLAALPGVLAVAHIGAAPARSGAAAGGGALSAGRRPSPRAAATPRPAT